MRMQKPRPNSQARGYPGVRVGSVALTVRTSPWPR